MLRGWALPTVLAAVIACAGCGGDGEERVEREEAAAAPGRASPPGVTASMVEEGSELYAGTCAVCHGPAGEGTQLGSALDDGEWTHISGELDEIIEVIRSGIEEPEDFPVPMPVMGGGSFTREQLRAVAAYTASLGPEP